MTLCGPQARNILRQLTKDDISNEAFPYMTCKQITIGYAPVLAIRITYVGELGWELHMPMESAYYVYDALWETGKSYGLVNAGYRCIDSLRLEKGYRYWSGDISPEYTPYEAGLDFCVKLEKGNVNEVISDLLHFLKEEATGRKVMVVEELATVLPSVQPVLLLTPKWI